MKSKQIKWLVWAGAVVAILVVAILAAISLLVPRYVERQLIPELAHKYGLDARQVQMRRIGWFGADLGPVHLDGNHTPVVSIAVVHIDYSPLALLRGKIKRIALGGVRVVLAATADGISIPGFTLPTGNPADKKPAGLPDLGTIIPVAVEQIRIDQSEVVLLWQGRPLSLSIDMTLGCADLDNGRLSASANLSFLGSTMVLTAALDQSANSAILTMEKSQLALGPLAGFVDLPPSVAVSSHAALKGQSSFTLMPFGLNGLSLSGDLEKTLIKLPHMTVQNLQESQGSPKAITIAVEAPEPPVIQWRISPFQINGRVNSHILEFKGEWTPDRPGWSLDGMMETLVPAQTLTEGTTLTRDVPIIWQFQSRQTAKNALEFNAHITKSHPATLGLAPFEITIPAYQISTTGRWVDRVIDVDTRLTANKIRLEAPDGEILMSDIKADSALALYPTDAPSPSELTVSVAVDGMRIKQGPAQFDAPRLDIATTGKRLSGQPWHYQSHLKLAKASLSDNRYGLRLGGIQIDMPLLWTPGLSNSAGTLNVQTIQWQNHHLGGLKGRLNQEEAALEISLRHNSKLFPKLNVLIHGRIDAGGTAVTATLPAYQFPQPVDLGRFIPKAAGVHFEGQIKAKADFSFNNDGLNSSAAMKISQASLRDAQRELGIEGINVDMVLDDILALKSAPQQRLRVDHLQFGKLVADNLDMDFQLEGPQTVFIEKAIIQWCLGRINSTALRITPDKERYDVTLFCDRLNLAMVLEQLGAGQAQGEGTVNGSIPIHWHNGRLGFDNGFLYSTPGKPGALQLTGTEALLAGLPPETPQHTQVDIATEALKDYTYNWAKLNVESHNENLLLKLQLDGKPNRLLPFAFDQELGRLKRVAGQGQADFKGISIDLNFKSPLDKILHYKELLTPNQ